MNREIDILREIRKNLIKVYHSVPNYQKTQIPNGFNNNMHWNLGHCLVTQQILMYKNCGLVPLIPETMIETYRKGSVPEEFEREELEQTMIASVDLLEQDLDRGCFENYQHYRTSFGVEIGDIEMALRFNNTHESMHLGYMMALKKALIAQDSI